MKPTNNKNERLYFVIFTGVIYVFFVLLLISTRVVIDISGYLIVYFLLFISIMFIGILYNGYSRKYINHANKTQLDYIMMFFTVSGSMLYLGLLISSAMNSTSGWNDTQIRLYAAWGILCIVPQVRVYIDYFKKTQSTASYYKEKNQTYIPKEDYYFNKKK